MARTDLPAPHVGGERSLTPRARRLLVLAALIPLITTAALFSLGVPLGRVGQFTYLYSPIVLRRMTALPSALVIACVAAAAVVLLSAPRRGRRVIGGVLAGAAAIAIAAWSFFAPPDAVGQHFFNLQSPSHDGAFLHEAQYCRTVGPTRYLTEFPDRARRPPAEMKGTRIMSNPPGATLLAAAACAALDHSALLIRGLNALLANQVIESRDTWTRAMFAMAYAWTLIIGWLLAAPLLYRVGRLYFSPAAAAAYALCCAVTPATLLFSPGKDPAQLFSSALLIWLALTAYKRASILIAIAAGAAFVLGCIMSLVHVWIAAILLATVLREAAATRQSTRLLLRCVAPAIGGALAALVVLRVGADCDLLEIARTTAAAQAGVTRGPGAMPLLWQALGVPLFLLFAGPAFLAALAACHRTSEPACADGRFGRTLLLLTTIVAIATVGFTNMETPRLWIPLAPLLLLGAALNIPAACASNRTAAALAATVVFVQITASAVQWSFMDMRESEMRLFHRPGEAARLFH